MAKPGTLKVDHHVVSADGTRYAVRYVSARPGQPEEAELAELDDDGGWTETRITLPTAELRRVAAVKLPPIEGMPAERPRCVMCDALLRPMTDTEYAKRAGGSSIHRRPIKRTFRRWNGYWADAKSDAKFCTTRCAMTFARAAFAAGYRIVRKKGEAR